MARYYIIDTEKPTSIGGVEAVLLSLSHVGLVLSPEETEAKWKECFGAGLDEGYNSGRGYDEIPSKSWDEFKKTL